MGNAVRALLAGDDDAHPVADEAEADVTLDPENRPARWNAYAVDRTGNDSKGRPRPLAEQLAGYLSWVEVNPELRRPPLDRA